MVDISAATVKELREKTGAGMMDCKVALKESDGNIEKAIEYLRKKGLKDLGKRAGKIAAEGVIGVYSHPGEQVVAVVELNCETDFVGRGEEFRALARDVAMQVAASRPLYLNREEIPEGVVAKEHEILLEQLTEAQRSKADMILPGRMQKFYEEQVLLDQIFIKDEAGKKTIASLLQDVGIKTGERISIRRFARFEVGEGIERAVQNFADEVNQIATADT